MINTTKKLDEYTDYDVYVPILSALFDENADNNMFYPMALNSFLHSQVHRPKNDEMMEVYLEMRHEDLDDYIRSRVLENQPLMFAAAIDAYTNNPAYASLGRRYLTGDGLSSPYVEIWEQDGLIYVSTATSTLIVPVQKKEKFLDKAIISSVADLFNTRDESESLWEEEANGFIGWHKDDIPKQIMYIENGDIMFLLDKTNRVVGLLTPDSDEEAEPVDDLFWRLL